jgi:hypothetical protein
VKKILQAAAVVTALAASASITAVAANGINTQGQNIVPCSPYPKCVLIIGEVENEILKRILNAGSVKKAEKQP